MNNENNNTIYKALKILEAQHKLNPLRQAALKSELFDRIAQGKESKTASPTASWIVLFAKPLPITLAILVCVLISGGAAFATESSLPGDFLHPLKLVAEKIETRLAVSEESKAELEAKHTVARIEELNVLQTKIETETRSEIRANFEARRLSAENETQARLENTLSKLETIREDLSTKGNDKAALAVDTAIERLKNRAVESKFKFKFKTEESSTTHSERVDDNDSTNTDRSREINKIENNSVDTPDLKIDAKNTTDIETEVEIEKQRINENDDRSRTRVRDRN